MLLEEPPETRASRSTVEPEHDWRRGRVGRALDVPATCATMDNVARHSRLGSVSGGVPNEIHCMGGDVAGEVSVRSSLN